MSKKSTNRPMDVHDERGRYIDIVVGEDSRVVRRQSPANGGDANATGTHRYVALEGNEDNTVVPRRPPQSDPTAN